MGKETKEIEEINNVLKFDSIEDANSMEEVANGRKFCKRGERLQDICKKEIRDYYVQKHKNFIYRIYYAYKNNHNREKLLLESRVNARIRKIVKIILNNLENTNEIDEENIIEEVKSNILKKVNEYKRKN